MRRLLLALLLLPTAVLAQSTNADLSLMITLSLGGKLRPGQAVTWYASVHNKGPAPASDVVITYDIPGEITTVPPGCTAGRPVRCTIPSVALTPDVIVAINAKVPAAPGTYSATATVTSANVDPNPDDNTRVAAFEVSDAADVSLSMSGFERIGRNETYDVKVSIGISNGVARNVRLTLHATGGATIGPISAPAGFTCADAVCTAPLLSEPAAFNVPVTAPDREGGSHVVVDAAVTADDDFNSFNDRAALNAQVVRLFRVTSDADRGAGSLRDTILEANRGCSSAPCRVIFDLPASTVIHPESALPPVNGMVMIDGGGQITLRGDRQPSGDGMAVDFACEVLLGGLSIDGFRGNGVTIGSSVSAICPGAVFPPVNISGNTITRNLRGIVGSAADTVWIGGNVIGANLRSGIYLYGGRVARIDANFIGLTRDGAPLPNGASGIYVNAFSVAIEENVIANNTDFGVAVSASSPAIALRRNRIFDNGHTAIDVGLDLETPNGDDAHSAALNHPVLISARYDAATDKTIVRGRYDTQRRNGTPVIELFASSSLNAEGRAQTERFLVKSPVFENGDFEFPVSGNLTGQWITATATMEDSLSVQRDVTSELSPPIRVTP